MGKGMTRQKAFWGAAIIGLLTAANCYLFFEDGLLAASSSDAPSPDDVDISESGPDSIPDKED